METTKTTSIASLSAQVAWKLLTPEEQRLLLAYLEKVRESKSNDKTYKEQVRVPVAER